MRCTWTIRMVGLALLFGGTGLSQGEESLIVVPGRNPYLGEAVGHVVVTMAPDREGESLILEVATENGTRLGDGPVLPGRRSAIEFPLEKLAQGTTLLHCRLLSAGRELTTAQTQLTRLPPKPHAVQIDNRCRGLMVDGLPFFPVGFWNQPPGRPEGDPNMPPDLAAQGFNLYAPLSSGEGAAGVEHIRTWMDRCAEVGMKVNYDIRYECFASREAEMTPEAWQAVRTLVEALRDHPALLSWYISDEPVERDYERVAGLYRFVKELDPYHPAVIQGPSIFPPYISEGQRPSVDWRQITDVTWLDAYPVNRLSRDQKDNPYWLYAPPDARRSVATMTAFWLARDDHFFGYSSPLWHSPQLVGGGGTIFPSEHREPSAQEVRAMTYAGLITGATTLQYFLYTPGIFPKSPRLMAEAARLAQEAMELTPFLLSEEPRRTVTADSPDIMTAGWQDRGMALVIALNVVNDPANLKVTLSDSSYSGPAEVLFENRRVEVREGVIEDTIEAQGTRVYQIPEGPFPADRAALDPANLRLNPSFEEWFNPGSMPDNIVKTRPGCTCFLDARTSAHGRHSVRMTAAGPEGVWMDCIKVDLQPSKRYRVSIWARADRPGAVLRLTMPHTDRADGEKLTLGTDWKECSFVATAQNESFFFDRTGNAVECVPNLQFNGPGVAWVDLFQVVPAE